MAAIIATWVPVACARPAMIAAWDPKFRLRVITRARSSDPAIRNFGGVVRRPVIDVNNLESDARRALARCGNAGMEFGEGVLVMVGGNDNGKSDHSLLSVASRKSRPARGRTID